MKVTQKIVNHGFQEPTILGGQWWQGEGRGITSGIKPLDRDWRPYLSQFEPQRRSIESSFCTEFGTLEGVETIIKRKYGIIENYSERALAILADNSPQGNDPHITADTLRKSGARDEKILPFTDGITSWEDLMNPAPLSKKQLENKRWAYSFAHEWEKPEPEKLWNSLQFSPLGVSVMAWRKKGEFYVKEKGERDTHWTLLVWGEYKKYWIVSDSYLDNGERFKKLNWEYPFGFSKIYSVSKKQLGWPKNWMPCLFQ